jgi:hypothetical protein
MSFNQSHFIPSKYEFQPHLLDFYQSGISLQTCFFITTQRIEAVSDKATKLKVRSGTPVGLTVISLQQLPLDIL